MKILLCDDHPIFLSGLRALFEVNKEMQICGEATNGLDAISMTKKLKPDVIIMDINMPGLNGIEATREIISIVPEAKILSLSIHSNKQFVQEMLDAGAVGYLSKDDAPDELLRAVEKVNNGEMYLSSRVTRVALNKDEDVVVYNVLQTKLLHPPILSDYLVRKRITDELEQGIGKPLSLISAGAGYGKSIVVSQWMEQSDHLHAWISLDDEHNDLRVFLLYVVTAIRQVIPDSMNEIFKAISGVELPNLKELKYVFFTDLCEIENDIILVLDDYHKIHLEKIHHILIEWLRFPPPNIHLSIITRRDPPIDLNSVRLTDRMTEIRMDKLSFQHEEISDFFKQKLDIELSDKNIKRLYNKTEGWIIPITLSSILLKNAEDIDAVVDKIDGNMTGISEYLVSEVLSTQPIMVQNPLLVSSILDRFCAEILDEIFLNETELNGVELIDFVDTANMFIIELDNEKKWFRYHHLFQALLKEQLLKKHSTKEITKYHLKASQWFEKQNLLEEAMEHALTIKDYDWAAEIVIKNRLTLLNNNNYYRLEQLQRKLPISTIESDAELVLAELYLQWNHGNFVRLGELEEIMNPLIDGLAKDSNVRDEFHFFDGFNSLFLRGDLEAALKHFDIAMERVPESAAEPRGVLETHYMIFTQFAGAYKKIRNMFHELIVKDMTDIRKNRVYQGYLAASLDQANMNEIESNHLNAISFARDSKMKDALGLILYMSGSMKIRIGSLNIATEYFNEILDMRYFVHSRVVTDSLTGLIIIYSLKNEKGKAEEVLKILENYTDGLGDFFKTFTLSAKIRYHLINRDHNAVKELLKDYKPGVLDLVMWVNVPEITHARALIFEGSKENLKLAEEELNTLKQVITALHNQVHLLEVYVLQALCFDKLGESEKAATSLNNSIEIAEPSQIVTYYIELGEPLEKLISKMPDEFKKREFIKQIRNSILALKLNKYHTTSDKLPKEIKKEKSEKLNLLSSRELEVLECVALGLRNQEIADKIFVANDTIKKHIYNMFQKLHVKNRLSLVSKAKEMDILE